MAAKVYCTKCDSSDTELIEYNLVTGFYSYLCKYCNQMFTMVAPDQIQKGPGYGR